MKRRGILLVVPSAIIAILLFFWLRGAALVDSGPPIAAADNYFSKLKLGQTDAALGSYSEDFRAKNTQWPQLLSGLQERYGAVTKAALKGSSVVPLSGVGCTILVYQVQREKLLSEEKLIFCAQEKAGASIVGHELIRLDTGQKFAGGVTLRTTGLTVP